jgi:hypothetical protein
VRARTLLIVTAIVSMIIGAVVVYLVLTVPNDVQASALMNAAHRQIAAGDNDHARETLSKVVQQYPRTDAAAAATVALVSLADNERHKLEAELAAVRSAGDAQQKQIAALTQRVDELAARPAPQSAPPPAPAPKPARHATSKRRRRR